MRAKLTRPDGCKPTAQIMCTASCILSIDSPRFAYCFCKPGRQLEILRWDICSGNAKPTNAKLGSARQLKVLYFAKFSLSTYYVLVQTPGIFLVHRYKLPYISVPASKVCLSRQPRHSGVWRRTIPELIKSAGQLASTIIEHYCPVPLQCANGLEHM